MTWLLYSLRDLIIKKIYILTPKYSYFFSMSCIYAESLFECVFIYVSPINQEHEDFLFLVLL